MYNWTCIIMCKLGSKRWSILVSTGSVSSPCLYIEACPDILWICCQIKSRQIESWLLNANPCREVSLEVVI